VLHISLFTIKLNTIKKNTIKKQITQESNTNINANNNILELRKYINNTTVNNYLNVLYNNRNSILLYYESNRINDCYCNTYYKRKILNTFLKKYKFLNEKNCLFIDTYVNKHNLNKNGTIIDCEIIEEKNKQALIIFSLMIINNKTVVHHSIYDITNNNLLYFEYHSNCIVNSKPNVIMHKYCGTYTKKYYCNTFLLTNYYNQFYNIIFCNKKHFLDKYFFSILNINHI